MSKLPFDLEQLRCLKALSSEQSFTKAAKTLYISQSSISHQIQTLEKKLNVALIIRQNKKITLTRSGSIFLKYSERILALCEESCRAIVDLRYGNRGSLVIGASQTIGMYFLPKILTVFSKKHPQIYLESKINTTRIISKKILNGEIDLAIVAGEIPLSIKKNLTTFNFLKDELLLILPNSYFISKNNITKYQLYNLNFIMLNSDSTSKKYLIQTLKKNNINLKQLKIIMELDSIEAIKTAVSAGVGAAFVSSLAIEQEIYLNKIKVIKIDNTEIKRNIFILINPEHYLFKALELFYVELFLSYKLPNSKKIDKY